MCFSTLFIAVVFCLADIIKYNSRDVPSAPLANSIHVLNTSSSISIADYDTGKFHPCNTNPYKDAITKSFDEILTEMDRWLNYGSYSAQLDAIKSNTILTNHDHTRFFPFQVMAPCSNLVCVGGICSDDVSKFVCGMDRLVMLDECVIYSIGGNNEWEFEEDVSKLQSKNISFVISK